jgi:hypothetical protein
MSTAPTAAWSVGLRAGRVKPPRLGTSTMPLSLMLCSHQVHVSDVAMRAVRLPVYIERWQFRDYDLGRRRGFAEATIRCEGGDLGLVCLPQAQCNSDRI